MIPSKIFIFLRSFIFPFHKLENYIPKEGKIIDIGCGHGVMSILLAKASQKRKVLGIDPDQEKIRVAKKLGQGIKNLTFKAVYLRQIKRKFDAAVIVDVLYLLPDKEKLEILKEARRRLKKNGKLILKETSKEPGWFYWLLVAQELLMVKVLQLTHSDYGQIFILGREDYKKFLQKAGFKVEKTEKIKGLLPYPHILFVATAGP